MTRRHPTLDELKRNLIAAACMLAVVGIGAVVVEMLLR
jgi:hypothetical protein